MKYMILCFDPEQENIKDIPTIEEAKDRLEKMVKKYARKHKINLEDAYEYSDTEFLYCEYEVGCDAYKIIEVPEFKNEFERLAWEAKYWLTVTEIASLDYQYALENCSVDYYTEKVTEIIDKMLKLKNIKGE